MSDQVSEPIQTCTYQIRPSSLGIENQVEVVAPDGEVVSRGPNGEHVKAIAWRYHRAYMLGAKHQAAANPKQPFATLANDYWKEIVRLRKQLSEISEQVNQEKHGDDPCC